MATDALGRLATVTDLSGGAPQTGSRAFRYFGSALVAEYGTTGSASGVLEERYVPGPGTDEPIVSYPGASTATRYWLLADERGSVITTADGNGNVVGTNTYDDYGLPASGNTGRFQYTGQIWIPEAGLYHYKARDYSPTLGRFLQTDPIGYGDGMNWYAYAHNDPINRKDPWGLATTPAGGAIFTGPTCDSVGSCVSQPGPTDVVVTGIRNPCPDGAICAAGNMFDTSTYFQSNTTPSYAPTPPPANPAGAGQQAVQQAAKAATQGSGRCPSGPLADFAKHARQFGSNVQAGGDWTAVAGTVVTAGGAVTLQPEVVAFGAAGILVGKTVSVAGLGLQLAAGAYLYYAGDPKPLTSTVVGQAVSDAFPPALPGADASGSVGDAVADKAYKNRPDC